MQHTPQEQQVNTSQPAAQREANPDSGNLSAQLACSPRQAAQRRQLEDLSAAAVQRAVDDDSDAAQLNAEHMQSQDNRTGMPDGLKAGIEALSGMDMSDVRVHCNSSQPSQLNALAYAQGNDIHLAPGLEQHLPHESWHVVQQRQGRVQATMQMAGVGVNDDVGLESEADVMGGRAVQLQGDSGNNETLTPSHVTPNLQIGPGVGVGYADSVQTRSDKPTEVREAIDLTSALNPLGSRVDTRNTTQLRGTGGNTSDLTPSLAATAAAVQFKGHKPQVGQKIRYPATGPKDGDLYTVVDAREGGPLKVTKDKDGKTSNLDWLNDEIWLVYQPDAKDTDLRLKHSDWENLSALKKAQAYEGAKAQALKHLLASAEGGMVNATNKNKLKRDVTLDKFVRQRAGEWQMTWDEVNARRWQFTIDMDKPLADSWQEPHVGWEVKLLVVGANNGGTAYEAFPKQQGHVWMNDVPEFRT